MTSLICAISNEVPEQPVVSPVSGQVYERRLIEKFLADNGVDPVNKVDHNVQSRVFTDLELMTPLHPGAAV